jgi:NAD(P)-dependent dehydrogenase (short-subunit alcohol dehydrogenase family)|tara:strand:+ start:2765 stop:3541 length:777 start_codon:yes stop_codon:yes gene_type:complete
MKILKDKKVIILGGSGLIGKSITKAFLSNGAKVLNLDIKKNLVKNMNYKYIKFDCTNLDDLNSNLNTVIAQNSTPDIFVNASYPRSQDWANNNFKNIKLSSLRHNIEIFLNSSAWCCKYFADKMSLKKKRGGSIVMIGSIYSKVGQNLNIYKGTKMTENYSYSIIKGGLDNATRQLASYYGKYDIRVNNLCPGALKSHVAGLSKKQDKRFIKNFKNQTPLKRLGTSKDVANVALFLASDLSSYITGQSILVDGGYTSI